MELGEDPRYLIFCQSGIEVGVKPAVNLDIT